MIKTVRIIIYATAALLLAWMLPWLGDFLFSSPYRTPFTHYSCTAERFVVLDHDGDGVFYHDMEGNTYTEAEFDSMLPMFYYRQLLADGRLPDTIRGVAVTPQTIGRENFMFRTTPSDINVCKPRLYPLLESMSGRVELQMPPDVFRMKPEMEFIDIASNEVDEEKSLRFAKVLRDKGFVYPAKVISGNPTTRKEYDEGYLLIDAEGKLFHLKQTVGRPYFRQIPLPAGVVAEQAFITEFSSRANYGFVTDTQNRLYAVSAPGYEVRELPVEGFDPYTESISMIGDMFNWTLRINGHGRERYYAVDAGDFSLAATHTYDYPEDRWDAVSEYLFPFRAEFTSHEDKFVRPRIGGFSWKALIINAVLAVAFFVSGRRRRAARGCRMLQAALILPLGVFLFIPSLILKD